MDTTARRVVEALLDARLLDPALRDPALDVATRALADPQHAPTEGPPSTSRSGVSQVVEVVAYLGGALVLAAGSLLVFDIWPGLGFGAQVAWLSVVTVVLAVAGGAVALTGRGVARRAPEHDARRRLAGALLSAAALCAGGLAALVLDRGFEVGYDGPGGVDVVGLVAASVTAVAAVAGYRLAPTALGLVAAMGSTLAATTSLLAGTEGAVGTVTTSLALLALGLVWLALAETRVVHETTVARVLAALLVLAGAQWPVVEDDTQLLAYALTAAVAAAGAAAYLRLGAWPYLAVAVLAVTLVVPEAVSDWTGGGLGAIGAVLLTGVTLLAASGAATVVRSRRVRAEVA